MIKRPTVCLEQTLERAAVTELARQTIGELASKLFHGGLVGVEAANEVVGERDEIGGKVCPGASCL